MHALLARILLVALVAAAAPAASAQSSATTAPPPTLAPPAASAPATATPPAPPAPAFVPANVTADGARALAASCAICHGPQGRTARGSAVPALAGRQAQGIVAMMAAFKEGKAPATIMHQIAKAYGDAEIAAIADYFAAQAAR